MSSTSALDPTSSSATAFSHALSLLPLMSVSDLERLRDAAQNRVAAQKMQEQFAGAKTSSHNYEELESRLKQALDVLSRVVVVEASKDGEVRTATLRIPAFSPTHGHETTIFASVVHSEEWNPDTDGARTSHSWRIEWLNAPPSVGSASSSSSSSSSSEPRTTSLLLLEVDSSDDSGMQEVQKFVAVAPWLVHCGVFEQPQQWLESSFQEDGEFFISQLFEIIGYDYTYTCELAGTEFLRVKKLTSPKEIELATEEAEDDEEEDEQEGEENDQENDAEVEDAEEEAPAKETKSREENESDNDSESSGSWRPPESSDESDAEVNDEDNQERNDDAGAADEEEESTSMMGSSRKRRNDKSKSEKTEGKRQSKKLKRSK